MVYCRELSLANRKLSELRPATFQIAGAPAHDLEVAIRRHCAVQFGRLEVAPKLCVGAGQQREVGMIINPGDFTLKPASAPEFLQSYQRAVIQFLCRREEF